MAAADEVNDEFGMSDFVESQVDPRPVISSVLKDRHLDRVISDEAWLYLDDCGEGRFGC